MARKKEFNREKALDQALLVFRKKGYAATTTDDLRLEMGIGRQSFYDTFIGKKEIYSEALRKYATSRTMGFLAHIKSSKSPLKAIENMLLSVALEDDKERELACLGVSSICEFGSSDKEINFINETSGETMKTFLEKLIAEGKSKGEIRSSKNPSEISDYLMAVLSGLRVYARAGGTPEMLKSIARIAVEGLKAV